MLGIRECPDIRTLLFCYGLQRQLDLKDEKVKGLHLSFCSIIAPIFYQYMDEFCSDYWLFTNESNR